MFLNWEKCHFIVKHGIFLNHIISNEGIEVDKVKVDLISNLPLPKTVKEVRSLFEHAGFYRCFVKDFSKISRFSCNLIASLISHEEDLAIEKCAEDKKKMTIALKASELESDEEFENDEGSEFEDEEISMIAQKFKKVFKKSNERRKFRNLKNQKEKKETIITLNARSMNTLNQNALSSIKRKRKLWLE